MRTFVNLDEAMVEDAREAKLPAWARDRLSALRRGVSDYTSLYQDHVATVEPTQVYWERCLLERNPVFIPERADVVFDFGGKQRHHDRLAIRWDGARVQVMAGRSVNIRPQASNTFSIGLE